MYSVVQSRPKQRTLLRSLTETSDSAGVPLQTPVAEVKGLFTKPSPQGGVKIEDVFAKVFGRESSEHALHRSEDATSVLSSTRKHTSEKAEEKLVASPFTSIPALERKTTSTKGI